MSATLTELDRFTEAVGEFAEWASVDDIVSACDAGGFFDGDFRASAEAKAKKALVRRLMKRVKDSTGFPVWASIKTTDDEGNTAGDTNKRRCSTSTTIGRSLATTRSSRSIIAKWRERTSSGAMCGSRSS